MRRTWFFAGLALFLSSALFAESLSTEQAKEAMKKATLFFKSIATNGGYVGIYSVDLKERYGENFYEPASVNEIWVQRPGTPSIGECYLRAYKATGDAVYLDCARAVGLALAWAQRKEGGWDHRNDVSQLVQGKPPVKMSGRCSFDDDISQGVLTYLISLDEVIDEKWLTDSINLAIEFFKEAQFDNGAWPQWYPLIGYYKDKKNLTGEKTNIYNDYYTFNDNAMDTCIRMMLFAHEKTGREDCLKSAKLGGDFIIASQLPAPQSGWAQQYSHDMKPAWARSFEPPGVGSSETGQQIRMLMDLYLYTGDKKYLEPIPKAIDWLNRSKIADNTWARLNEVGTNKPIYGDRDGKVHYKYEEISEERRKGYGFRGGFGIPGIIQDYNDLMKQGRDSIRANRSKPPTQAQNKKRLDGLAAGAARAVSSLDERGRWIELLEPVYTDKINQPPVNQIRSATFVRNMNTLIEYIELAKETQ